MRPIRAPLKSSVYSDTRRVLHTRPPFQGTLDTNLKPLKEPLTGTLIGTLKEPLRVPLRVPLKDSKGRPAAQAPASWDPLGRAQQLHGTGPRARRRWSSSLGFRVWGLGSMV